MEHYMQLSCMAEQLAGAKPLAVLDLLTAADWLLADMRDIAIDNDDLTQVRVIAGFREALTSLRKSVPV